MNKEELKRLYREKILVHNKDPYHFEKKEDAQYEALAYNPTCGDKYVLYWNDEDGRLEDTYFHGFGCAISKASSSIMLQLIEGKTKTEIMELCSLFINSLSSVDPHEFDDEYLNVLVELKNFEGRIDCLKLSWETLLEHLKGQ